MTLHSYITTLTIALCVTSTFVTHGQSHNGLQFDTSKTAIIPFDQKANYPFDNSFKPSTLTQNDIRIIDSLLIACVADYNDSLDKDYNEWNIDLNKYRYRKQLVVVTNKKGEKEVWVNCFCGAWDDRWKTQLMLIDDGGSCNFNFKINLATKRFYDLGVNGLA